MFSVRENGGKWAVVPGRTVRWTVSRGAVEHTAVRSSSSWDPSCIGAHTWAQSCRLFITSIFGRWLPGSLVRGSLKRHDRWLWGPTVKSASVCVTLWLHASSGSCPASALWVSLHLLLPGTDEVETVIEPSCCPAGPWTSACLVTLHWT